MGDMPVEVVEYDPTWPHKFDEQRDELSHLLEPWLQSAIEHVGSTSVPGLAAKPIIDIAAPVTALHEARAAVSVLEQRTWCYWADDPNQTWRLWFLHPRPDARTHHLYLIPHDDPHLHELLAFRDHLRAHADVRHRYAALKTALAQEHRGNRNAYTAAKTEFVAEVLSMHGLQLQPRTAPC
ncbi:GrpB-like predicted nucleotidyltransferase (UPF0157 family) [Mycobacterium frederiksbergense]|uniref:GrpB-like predicted nucleotidyltransferase (UPF0157 family) n=1 Tax=Mycolicibacterium frederiksbergense TaxID=117567 RepID=A0ABT6KTQ8_9MYCO|nr:GrpB family protein [Mycolicibacterium frederiksbergense]MDH6194096.1 GrpB-like predicted nucleotidyltransferase (UPF0157 family) [Mycolicibacterium frederiksbergense]